MDLRSFLRPASRAIAATPEPGSPAPPLPIPGAARRPRIVAFLRHVGCPFAEATLRELEATAAGESAVDFVAVSHGSREDTAHWVEALGGVARVELLVDPERELYADWGLGLTSLRHFAGGRSLRAVVALARRGIRNRHPSGTRWQRAGTFAIDAADAVRWRHLPAHAGELPDLDAALASVRD